MHNAVNQATALELDWFTRLVAEVMGEQEALLALAAAVAQLDVAVAGASLAEEWHYCRPEIRPENSEDAVFEINEGRHPVVEQMLASAQDDGFVVNGC